MASEETPRDADFETENSRLNEGLKMCRAMVANYRAMLSRNEVENAGSTDEAYGEMSGHVSNRTKVDGELRQPF